eukprot:6153198-Prymnesium_polylepis.2
MATASVGMSRCRAARLSASCLLRPLLRRRRALPAAQRSARRWRAASPRPPLAASARGRRGGGPARRWLAGRAWRTRRPAHAAPQRVPAGAQLMRHLPRTGGRGGQPSSHAPQSGSAKPRARRGM